MGTVDVLACSIAKVVHDDCEFNNLVGLSEQGLVIIGQQRHVVEGVQLVDKGWLGKRQSIIIYEPAGDVPVQVIRKGIE